MCPYFWLVVYEMEIKAFSVIQCALRHMEDFFFSSSLLFVVCGSCDGTVPRHFNIFSRCVPSPLAEQQELAGCGGPDGPAAHRSRSGIRQGGTAELPLQRLPAGEMSAAFSPPTMITFFVSKSSCTFQLHNIYPKHFCTARMVRWISYSEERHRKWSLCFSSQDSLTMLFIIMFFLRHDMASTWTHYRFLTKSAYGIHRHDRNSYLVPK